MAVDLALAKAHLRVTASTEDTLIQRYINAAAAALEQRTGALLTRREVKQRFSAFSPRLRLDWGPDSAEGSIAYVDVDGTDQELDDLAIVEGRIYPPTPGWPAIATNSVIEVTYTAGFTDVPEDIETAQLLLIQIAYERRSISADEERAIDGLVEFHRHIPL